MPPFIFDSPDGECSLIRDSSRLKQKIRPLACLLRQGIFVFGVSIFHASNSRMKLICNAIFIFSYFLWRSTLALSHPKEDLVISVGDSITAGFLANTSATSGTELDQDEDRIQEYEISALGTGNTSMHIIPPELWFAQLFNHKDSYSWASGKKIRSQFVRLAEFFHVTSPEILLEAKNVALSGAKTDDLTRQANEIVSLWKAGRVQNIRYLTFLIGANDICLNPKKGTVTDEEFKEHFRDFFARLAQIHQSEALRIIISSLPKIPDLGQPEIGNHVRPSGTTCAHQQLVVDHSCNRLIKWDTSEEYEQNVAIVEHTNEMIHALSLEIAENYPQFEIKYSDRLYHEKIQIGHLAEDCFHPNRFGQELISRLIWQDQPWWPADR